MYKRSRSGVPARRGRRASDTAMRLGGGHNQWDNQIVYACNQVRMRDVRAYLMVQAIIAHESGWNERARGDRRSGILAYGGENFFAGYCSIGLMQVNRCARPGLGARYDLRKGDDNILAGASLLAPNWFAYSRDYDRIAIGYNGPAVAAAGPPYPPSSKAYAKAVVGRLRIYAARQGVALG